MVRKCMISYVYYIRIWSHWDVYFCTLDINTWFSFLLYNLQGCLTRGHLYSTYLSSIKKMKKSIHLSELFSSLALSVQFMHTQKDELIKKTNDVQHICLYLERNSTSDQALTVVLWKRAHQQGPKTTSGSLIEVHKWDKSNELISLISFVFVLPFYFLNMLLTKLLFLINSKLGSFKTADYIFPVHVGCIIATIE